MPTLKAEFLERLIAECFSACKVPAEHARIVAGHLVDAEACGVTSHGVARVPQYLDAIQEGRIATTPELGVVSETVATARLDGQRGLGPVMALLAMDFAITQATRTGAAVVTLSNCSHTGRLGSYTEHAAKCGMAAMMMVNAGGHGQWVAPFGGTAGRLSTNPISIAVPANDGPIVLDIATSAAPEGKIRALMALAQSVPHGWLIDQKGRATTDPATLYSSPRGALLPFGGHKGFGLAVLIEALAGLLSGAGCCCDAAAPLAGSTDGVFIVVVDVRAFCDADEYRRQIGQLAQHLKTCPTASDVSEILLPGELERRTRERQLRDGIPVEEATWRLLEQIGQKLGISTGEVNVNDAHRSISR